MLAPAAAGVLLTTKKPLPEIAMSVATPVVESRPCWVTFWLVVAVTPADEMSPEPIAEASIVEKSAWPVL